MKFLVIARTKDSFFTLPPERQMELGQGVRAFVDKYRKAGRCKEIYWIPDLQGTASIWEPESSADVDEGSLENPMAPFLNIERYVLSDYDTHSKKLTELIERLVKK